MPAGPRPVQVLMSCPARSGDPPAADVVVVPLQVRVTEILRQPTWSRSAWIAQRTPVDCPANTGGDPADPRVARDTPRGHLAGGPVRACCGAKFTNPPPPQLLSLPVPGDRTGGPGHATTASASRSSLRRERHQRQPRRPLVTAQASPTVTVCAPPRARHRRDYVRPYVFVRWPRYQNCRTCRGQRSHQRRHVSGLPAGSGHAWVTLIQVLSRQGPGKRSAPSAPPRGPPRGSSGRSRG
jgi:hypothetical protein